jgi:hypothetical protein
MKRGSYYPRKVFYYFIATAVILLLHAVRGAPYQSFDRVLVTLAYGEGLGNGGEMDMHNLNFFFKVVLPGRVPGTRDVNGRVDYIIVVNGIKCTPCDTTFVDLYDHSRRTESWTILQRQNAGMDFGAYKEAIDFVKKTKRKYKHFIFLNSSLRGPFMPKWTPRNYHFVDALTQFMTLDKRVKLVSSYVSCLHDPEPVPSPIAESLFFAVDQDSLEWLLQDRVLFSHSQKTDTIIQSEYHLMKSVITRGFRAENLVTRYKIGLDWADKKHHLCNDGRHSSRRGSLEGGISVSPYEAIFVKTSWCVRAAEVGVLSKWLLRLSDGQSGTEGWFDYQGWAHGASPEGTSSKNGTVRPDVPPDGCMHGDIKGLEVFT